MAELNGQWNQLRFPKDLFLTIEKYTGRSSLGILRQLESPDGYFLD